ncbi:DUF3750 domain-containing protein [Mongoliimonas terrestris]|uniref:DUF3750 domain-containing protein n=1 Tax=Mongoliimonas terrestris TaxID=1709001 RepID=UPI0009495520|nr:DUF3750 domain-containing protein [Mongoliimonas terrestris]
MTTLAAVLRWLAVGFLVLYLLPIAVSALLYYAADRPADWRSADRSSAGLLPTPPPEAAVVRIFSARTVRWRGIFATHAWIVVKDQGEPDYERWDYTAWGDPIRRNGFVADGRWFGSVPDLVFAVDGDAAARLIPKIRAAIETYRHAERGSYRAWPGPNSNTFVAAVMAAVPEIRTALPPTAVGKDYPHDDRWVSVSPSGTGVRLTLGGYAGFTIGWVEGLEFNILGAIAGLDIARPGLKIPGLGRIGV